MALSCCNIQCPASFPPDLGAVRVYLYFMHVYLYTSVKINCYSYIQHSSWSTEVLWAAPLLYPSHRKDHFSEESR